MKRIPLLIASTLLTVSLSGCFEPVQVKRVVQTQVPINIHTASQVKQAIKLATHALGWTFNAQGSSVIAIKATPRDRIVVRIPYSRKGYQIILKSTTNMGYQAKRNTINTKYNTEVTNLGNAIDVNLYTR